MGRREEVKAERAKRRAMLIEEAERLIAQDGKREEWQLDAEDIAGVIDTLEFTLNHYGMRIGGADVWLEIDGVTIDHIDAFLVQERPWEDE